MNTPLTFGHTAQSLSLTIRLSWRHLVHPCGQVHVSIQLKGFDFGAGASFLVGPLGPWRCEPGFAVGRGGLESQWAFFQAKVVTHLNNLTVSK